MSLNRQGAVAHALDRDIISLVAVNEVRFAAFTSQPEDGQISAIGCRGLSACSVVILAAKDGAIVAHIGPNEPGATAIDSYIKHTIRLMERFRELYEAHGDLFDENARRFVIVATINGNVLVPEQQQLILAAMGDMGLEAVTVERPMLPPASVGGAPGTLMVIGNRREVRVLLEDRNITDSGGLSNASGQTVASNATAQAGSSQQVPTWYHVQGGDSYHLMAANGGTIRSSVDPPIDVYIRLITPQQREVGWIRWDGEDWDVIEE